MLEVYCHTLLYSDSYDVLIFSVYTYLYCTLRIYVAVAFLYQWGRGVTYCIILYECATECRLWAIITLLSPTHNHLLVHHLE